jgi:hypothetical protein
LSSFADAAGAFVVWQTTRQTENARPNENPLITLLPLWFKMRTARDRYDSRPATPAEISCRFIFGFSTLSAKA